MTAAPPSVPNISVSAEVTDYLRRYGREASFRAGEVICNRAPKPDLHLILNGEVEIRMQASADRLMPLSRLGAGATFGEMALVQGRAGSSVVVAATDCRVLTFPGERFSVALQECPAFRDYLLQRLSRNLQDTRAAAREFFRRAQAFQVLQVSGIKCGPLIAKSRSMRDVESKLRLLSGESTPVHLTGDPGVGKFLVASKLIEHRHAPEEPLSVVDCRKLGSKGGAKILFGTDSIDELSESFGALHLAHGGALILRHIEALDPVSQNLLERYLGQIDLIFPKTRIISTTEVDLVLLANQNGFHSGLARRLQKHSLRVPSLAERRKDVLRLANFFLAEHAPSKRLSRDAGAVLFARKFRHENVSELKDTILLASHLSKTDEITEDQIPAVPLEEKSLLEFDLGKVPIFARLMDSRVTGLIQVITLAGFLLMVGLMLTGGSLAHFSNSLVWGVWEPLLILSFLYIGRAWCTICPLSMLGSLAKRFRILCLERPHPAWFAKAAVPVSVAGFLGIILAEHYYEMPHDPVATAAFLATMSFAMVILSHLYQRQAFCQHFCPLGALGAALSPAGALQLRANPLVCTTQCTSHDCNGKERGCPVFHHPLRMGEGDRCKLCLKCLTSCPHGSTKVFFRPALTGLWTVSQIRPAVAHFSFAMFWLSALMMTLGHPYWQNHPVVLALVGLLSTLAGAATYRFFAHRFQAEGKEDPSIVSRIGVALLILSLGPMMAYQLGNIPFFTQLQVSGIPGSFLESEVLHGAPISFVGLLQIMGILIAGALFSQSLISLRRRVKKRGVQTTRKSWVMVSVMGVVYFLFALAYVGSQLTRTQ